MKKLLLAFCLLMVLPVHAADMPRSIEVTGEAVITIAPDLAVVPITVYTENAALKSAKAQNDEKINKLLELAKKYNVKAEDMQTINTSVQPLYDYGMNSGKPKLRGYQASATIQFKISPLEKVADFTDDVVQLGIDRVDGVRYELKDEKKLEYEALEKAIANAKAKAEKIATTVGMSLGKPLHINESGGINHPPYPVPMRAMAKMDMAASASPPPDMPAGTIEVRKNVSISYEMK